MELFLFSEQRLNDIYFLLICQSSSSELSRLSSATIGCMLLSARGLFYRLIAVSDDDDCETRAFIFLD